MPDAAARDEREAHCQSVVSGCCGWGSQLVGFVGVDEGRIRSRLDKWRIFRFCFNGGVIAVSGGVRVCGGVFALLPVVAYAGARCVEVGLEVGMQICLCVEPSVLQVVLSVLHPLLDLLGDLLRWSVQFVAQSLGVSASVHFRKYLRLEGAQVLHAFGGLVVS